MEAAPPGDRLSVSPPAFEGATCRVRVAGEIDPATCSILARALSSLPTAPDLTRVEIDLAAVSDLDPAALRPLLRLRRALSKRGATLVIVNNSAHVRQVLSRAGLNTFFGVLPEPPSRPGERRDQW